jgi:ribosome-associated toxin RatA of RatAB toxin-antitoxin module
VHSEIAIDIDAPPAAVFAIVHDVTHGADLLPHYVRSRLVERHDDGSVTADFVARRVLVPVLGLGLPVTWRSRVWADGSAPSLRFRHVAGATRGMDVVWRIEPRATGDASDGCRVTIEHEFRPRIPGFARFVDRWFTRSIAGRTLATTRAIAEVLEAGRAATASDPA